MQDAQVCRHVSLRNQDDRGKQRLERPNNFSKGKEKTRPEVPAREQRFLGTAWSQLNLLAPRFH
jgi:hypothetical protein